MKRPHRGRRPVDDALKPYPGLTIERGVYYIRHPVTKLRASLGTKDFAEAVTHYLLHKKQWEDQVNDLLADRIVEKMLALSNKTVAIKHRASQSKTLAQYAKYIRTDWLGYNFDNSGKLITPIVPKLLSNTKIKKRQGKPISANTARDYGQIIRYKVEEDERLAFPLSTAREESVLFLRAFLADWLTQPSYYNNIRACLSKVYQQAIREGLATTNPLDDIEMLITPERKVRVDDEPYIKITSAMMKDQRQNQRTKEWIEVDTEWEARACDMLYLVGGRPSDTLLFKDKDFSITRAVNERGDSVRRGTLTFEQMKTGTLQEIELSEAVIDLVEWFRDWKKRNRLVSPYLICYPSYIKTRLIGRPVSPAHISRRWAECVVKAGYEKGQYWLYDLRKKSMTDEQRKQGRHNKGGHKNESTRERYILDEVPLRSTTVLAALPRK